jgi:MraZ protein
VQHAVLFGEHELSLDAKNRLLVPVEIRKSLSSQKHGEPLFVVLGRNRRPWLYARPYYEYLVSLGQQKLMPNEDLLSFDQFYFAMATLCEPDNQGRILLPDRMLKRTGMTREVALIGVRDHLELWPRNEWERRREELWVKAEQVQLKAEIAQLQNELAKRHAIES